ncbi:hypothetical protein TorRG33x02_322450 [Trema orientale]|uniref:Uncharacterized protein n=1 Tax=Trema orientale TaxID=63057 RepID=A0A2P5BFX9_TREOI|nr:hypothetical protein TorRG33x02_322450 [Trema orientale]
MESQPFKTSYVEMMNSNDLVIDEIGLGLVKSGGSGSHLIGSIGIPLAMANNPGQGSSGRGFTGMGFDSYVGVNNLHLGQGCAAKDFRVWARV